MPFREQMDSEESIEKNPRNYDVWSGAESFLPVSPKGQPINKSMHSVHVNSTVQYTLYLNA